LRRRHESLDYEFDNSSGVFWFWYKTSWYWRLGGYQAGAVTET
jgi:hypothetical protein